MRILPQRVWLRRLLLTCGLVILLTAVVGVAMILHILDDYKDQAARFDLQKMNEIPQRSAVYDVNGNLTTYIHGENRVIVPLADVSANFIQALLAREDARFREHRGVDYRGIARAAVRNFRAGSAREGASTITQQLARNSFSLKGRTYRRKLLEAMLALRIETELSKDRILELYVNRIYLGSGLYGVETASKVYFGKSSSELNLSQGALLAGLIRSPNRFSPLHDLKAALQERDTVLNRMSELNLITAEEAARTKATNLFVAKRRALPYQESYAMDAVIRDLEQILDWEQVYQGGFKIYTTIDPNLQALATAAVESHLDEIEKSPRFPHPKKAEFVPADDEEGKENPTDYLQGALVAIDNRTGAIRALVGGRDFQQSKYNRALHSKRQVGSTFKSFVFANAFQKGLLPRTLVDDSKIAPGEFKNIANNWSPENSDDEYLGLQPAEVGLIRSRNTMSIRVGEFVGLEVVQKTAQTAGLSNDIPNLPVIFLGAFETTLKDLTNAYTIFPNGGLREDAYVIARIEDEEGKTIYQAPHQKVRVVDADAAWMTSRVLEQVVKSGTAAKAKSMGLTQPAAGKTGTTNDYRDAWFIGYTSSLTCGVWVGFDQPQTIMEKGYGSTLALPIWVKVISEASPTEYPAKPFTPKVTVRSVTLCSVSNGISSPGCEIAGTSYQVDLPVARIPGSSCDKHLATPPPVFADGPLPPPNGAIPTAPSANVPIPAAIPAGVSSPLPTSSRRVPVAAPLALPRGETVTTERLPNGGTAIIERRGNNVTITKLPPRASQSTGADSTSEIVPTARAQPANNNIAPTPVIAPRAAKSRVPVMRAEPAEAPESPAQAGSSRRPVLGRGTPVRRAEVVDGEDTALEPPPAPVKVRKALPADDLGEP